jgi:hypothetical protein
VVIRISHYPININYHISAITSFNLALVIFHDEFLFLFIIDMIYTYSPNWYKPQCLHFTQQSLFYCSNYILYEYSLAHKQIEREKCFREVALEFSLNHKDIKITAIESN